MTGWDLLDRDELTALLEEQAEEIRGLRADTLVLEEQLDDVRAQLGFRHRLRDAVLIAVAGIIGAGAALGGVLQGGKGVHR